MIFFKFKKIIKHNFLIASIVCVIGFHVLMLFFFPSFVNIFTNDTKSHYEYFSQMEVQIKNIQEILKKLKNDATNKQLFQIILQTYQKFYKTLREQEDISPVELKKISFLIEETASLI